MKKPPTTNQLKVKFTKHIKSRILKILTMKKEISTFKIFSLFFIIIFLSTFRTSHSQVTDTLDAMKDNTLYEDVTGSTSNGAGQHFFSGNTATNLKRRGLIAFDIAGSIPPCATITSVRLQLHLSKAELTGNRIIELRKLSSNWGEGTSHALGDEGGGASAASGDATWLHRFYNTSFWAGSGGDFSQTASSGLRVGTTLTFYTWSSTAQMIADVQGWLNNSQSNFGWMLLGDESEIRTSKRFDTKENDSLKFRPKLIVTYTLNKLALNSTSIFEGFWNGTSMVSDTARILLRNFASPYSKADSVKIKLNNSGKGIFCFNNAVNGSYYIVITHRNSVETWSKLPQTFTIGQNKKYDFTSSAAQAFGNNLTLKLGKYCIFSGDVNQDGNVDVIDLSLVDNDVFNFASGYISTDLNGDNNTDAIDISITDNNAFNFVAKITPP